MLERAVTVAKGRRRLRNLSTQSQAISHTNELAERQPAHMLHRVHFPLAQMDITMCNVFDGR